MSLRLLVDEDTQARRLVDLLRSAGHDVLTVQQAGLNGEPDVRVLEYARQEVRILLTQNCDDFRALHRAHPEHPGILAIFNDRDPTKNMTFVSIVKAIANLEASGWEFSGQLVAVNAWNY
ncbi:MAG TPA: DUF5615 family PIN-like protein [Chthonomonadaceae bacterium]|nr:DUF5615 family PIN-like protein [Chthonomonadaceae bacterium]